MAAHKEQHELRVFEEFASAALNTEINVGSESRPPPEPDVLFHSRSSPRYFELGRLLDAEHSRTVLKVLRQAPEPVTPNLSKIKLPEREVLRTKLRKTYATLGLPVELLLYYDTEHRHLEGGLPSMPFAEHASHVMAPMLRQSMGQFSRVWVFERYRGTVLWQYGDA